MVLFSSTYHALNRRYEPAKYQVDIALVISAADEKELKKIGTPHVKGSTY
jgi:hypothetical protein